MKKIITNSAQETILVGEKIGKRLRPCDVVLLTGDLSAGKTTFTKGIGKGLGVSKIINSPTFTIVKSYKGENVALHHLDLYRLDGVNQDFDLEEYMESGGICVIEWPFQVQEILPNDYLMVCLKRLSPEQREIEVTGVGSRYEELESDL